MAVSFDDKVEALKRLREKRLARDAQKNSSDDSAQAGQEKEKDELKRDPTDHGRQQDLPQPQDTNEELQQQQQQQLQQKQQQKQKLEEQHLQQHQQLLHAEQQLQQLKLLLAASEQREQQEQQLASVQSCEAQAVISKPATTEGGRSGEAAVDVAAPLAALKALEALGAVPAKTASGEAASRPDPAAQGGVGEMDALFCSGHCCERGLHGCDKDLERAAAFYRIAAEADHSNAQWRLAELLEFGRGVEQNEEEALKWYRRAAEAGHCQAQAGLGCCLEKRGGDENQVEALRWHLEAAQSGHALAQYCAACCLLEGRGCPQPDLEEGDLWLRKSADGGFPPAVHALSAASACATSRRPGTEADASLASEGAEEKRTTTVAARQDNMEDDAVGRGSQEADSSMISLAKRIASQLADLPDGEAAFVLERLMAEAEDLDLGEDEVDEESHQEGDDAAVESSSEDEEEDAAPARRHPFEPIDRTS